MTSTFTYLCDGFALLSVLFAVLAIANTRRPHLALVYLIGVFVTASVVLLMNNLTFTGIAYLIVYVGAILVLFLFVILLINLTPEDVSHGSVVPLRVAVLLGSVLLVYSVMTTVEDLSDGYTINNSIFDWYTPIAAQADTTISAFNQVQALASELYSSVTLLTTIGIILLLAMLSVIILSRKD